MITHETTLMGGCPYQILPATKAAELGIPVDAHTLRDQIQGLPVNEQRLRLAAVMIGASFQPGAPEEVAVLRDFLLSLSPQESLAHWDSWACTKSVYAALQT